ncbi:hypothetical protein CVT91_06920 [Candidatus Atribacteria bacterium HGW-Atribacteria-1]|nr:MAG: hypothetical protein CVT91_06920 [Candidatus Atribacteria bacterium HGW-Atribacteria-1]
MENLKFNITKEKIYQIKYELIKEALKDIGGLKIKVYGASMLPTFKPDDRVIIRPVNRLCIREKNCVLFGCMKHDLVFHRIIKINKNSIITKGDNSEESEIIFPSQIIGVFDETRDSSDLNQMEEKMYISSFDGLSIKLVVKKGILKKISLEGSHESSRSR